MEVATNGVQVAGLKAGQVRGTQDLQVTSDFLDTVQVDLACNTSRKNDISLVGCARSQGRSIASTLDGGCRTVAALSNCEAGDGECR